MLNDFNSHRKNSKQNFHKTIDDEFCLSSNNNIELKDTNKIEKINLSQKYQKELDNYNQSLIQNNNEINDKINPNNNINYYKKELNSIRQQIILLKSKLSENELIINDYRNTINVLNSKHTEEIYLFINFLIILQRNICLN